MIQPKLKLVIGTPKNKNLRGKVVFELVEDYELSFPNPYGVPKKLLVRIPAGFQTDGASIPRAFQGLVGRPFDTAFRAAALVHDWLYYIHTTALKPVDRAEADACLLALLGINGVCWMSRHAIYRAVRMAGWGYWENDVNDRAYLDALADQITARGQNPIYYGLAA
jgi:hypothetical protein